MGHKEATRVGAASATAMAETGGPALAEALTQGYRETRAARSASCSARMAALR